MSKHPTPTNRHCLQARRSARRLRHLRRLAVSACDRRITAVRSCVGRRVGIAATGADDRRQIARVIFPGACGIGRRRCCLKVGAATARPDFQHSEESCDEKRARNDGESSIHVRCGAQHRAVGSRSPPCCRHSLTSLSAGGSAGCEKRECEQNPPWAGERAFPREAKACCEHQGLRPPTRALAGAMQALAPSTQRLSMTTRTLPMRRSVLDPT
jgi:hypothetical protein